MESHKNIKDTKAGLAIVTLAVLTLLISSCSTPKVQPKAEIVELPTEALSNGRHLFDNHCASCHPGGKAGLAPGIINKPLPDFLIRFQIRNGVGLMPAFDEGHLSDEEVKNIADYLVYLRKNT